MLIDWGLLAPALSVEHHPAYHAIPTVHQIIATPIEELYKVSKQFLEVDQFHGRSERLVKQELFAHFNLIAMTRLFTNRDADVRQAGRPRAGKPAPQANFKHSLAALAQNLEGLLLRHTAFVSETLERICTWVGTGRRKPRSNRSYPRRSLQPAPKWSRRKAATA